MPIFPFFGGMRLPFPPPKSHLYRIDNAYVKIVLFSLSLCKGGQAERLSPHRRLLAYGICPSLFIN